jgi:hypothetical protein
MEHHHDTKQPSFNRGTESNSYSHKLATLRDRINDWMAKDEVGGKL